MLREGKSLLWGKSNAALVDFEFWWDQREMFAVGLAYSGKRFELGTNNVEKFAGN